MRHAHIAHLWVGGHVKKAREFVELNRSGFRGDRECVPYGADRVYALRDRERFGRLLVIDQGTYAAIAVADRGKTHRPYREGFYGEHVTTRNLNPNGVRPGTQLCCDGGVTLVVDEVKKDLPYGHRMLLCTVAKESIGRHLHVNACIELNTEEVSTGHYADNVHTLHAEG